jgi:flagellar hook-associated protein 2
MPTINFAGLASGIDTNGLIDATSAAARATRVDPYQKKVTELEETNSAVEDLNTKLVSLRTTLSQFNSIAGGAVSKLVTSSKESVATATATNSASNGSYSLTVTDIAKNDTYSFGGPTGSYSLTTDPVATAPVGTIRFTIGDNASDQETVDVTTTATTSIADFVSQFNSASSKAEASLVNVGTSASPAYRVVISSIYEGEDKGRIRLVAMGASAAVQTIQQDVATNARFSINGIGTTITRSTNSISDVISGVTIGLVAAGSATLKVGEDAATTASKVKDFVDQFNSIVAFVNENNLVSRQESGKSVSNVFSPLASSRVDDSAVAALKSALSSSTASSGSAVRIFADLGITTQRDGTLLFDSIKFTTAVSNEPSSVSTILQSFADTTTLTGGTIDLYTRFNGLFDTVINNNKSQITNLNTQISEAEKAIERQADEMRARFARLESTMGKLQQQQQSLTSALSGL